jgi:hypothetical protein
MTKAEKELVKELREFSDDLRRVSVNLSNLAQEIRFGAVRKLKGV